MYEAYNKKLSVKNTHCGVAQVLECPSKDPGSQQLYWRGFESWPRHKVVGTINPSCTICEKKLVKVVQIENVTNFFDTQHHIT